MAPARTGPFLRLLIGLGLVLLPVTAWADPRDDARRHFKDGLEAAAAGDYQRAVDEFLIAYRAIPHPATAFNIARAYEDLDDPEAALFWYEQVKALDPSRGADVDDTIAALRSSLGAEPLGDVTQRTDAELRDRLARLDKERQALMEELGERGQPEEPLVLGPVPVPDEAPAPPPPPPLREALLEDPYAKVIVTASRYGQAPLDTPASVTVLTGDEIRMSGAVHLADALRRVVGVDVMSMSSGVPYVGVRGFNSEMTNKVLWLIDGRPATLEFLATPFPFTLPVAMEEIERVEIIRGPGSAIYGANAVTGVVNVITRKPGEGPAFQAIVQAGLNRFLGARAVASGSAGRAAYRFSAGYQQEGRFEKAVDEIDPDGPILPFREDQDLGDQRFQASGRLDTTFADQGWASVSGAFSNGFSEYYSKAALGNFGLEGTLGYVRGDIGYGPLHLRAYWSREDGITGPWLASKGGSRSPGANVRDDVADVEVEGNFEIGKGPVQHRIHVGGNYRFKQYRAGVKGEGFEVPRQENHVGLFGQYQLTWRWLQAVASLRWDRHPLIALDRTIAPRGSLLFRVGPTTALRASAGTAYRAMNGLESYVNLELNTAADGYFVNFYGAVTDPDPAITLGPESITSAELGVRDESSTFHVLDAAVFWNRVTNLIDIGSVQPTLGYFQPASSGYPFGRAGWVNDTDTVYDSFGGEVDLTFTPADGLDVFGNIALQKILGRRDDLVFDEGSTALVHANVGVLYRAPFRMDFTLTGHYVSAQTRRIPEFDERGVVVVTERSTPDRFLMVARIAGRPILKPEMELAATLWNPLGFGEGFREHPDGQIVGPRVIGSAKVTF